MEQVLGIFFFGGGSYPGIENVAPPPSLTDILEATSSRADKDASVLPQ